jgi:hypothetical protein
MKSRLFAVLCLSISQPTIRSSLSCDTLQPTICCPLCSTCRYCYRLPTQLCLNIYCTQLFLCALHLATLQSTIRSAIHVDITSDRLTTLLCRVVYYTRLSYVLYSVWRFYNRLSNLPTILHGDSTTDYLLCCNLSRETTTDYLRCSTMSGVTTTDYPLYSTCRYYNRLSALPILRHVGVPLLLGLIGCRINWNCAEARLNMHQRIFVNLCPPVDLSLTS